MLTISLTSIPPRFPMLGAIVTPLLAQSIPVRVVLCLPIEFRRFPTPVSPPDLPDGVIVRRCTDYGPATKLLGCLDDPDASDILYCDDDWLYEHSWAETMCAARASRNGVVAASTFPVSRLKRQSMPGLNQVAQGFAGVLVRKNMFDSSVSDMPDAAFAADDIWLSGYLAAHKIPIWQAPEARQMCTPAATPGEQLQDSCINGLTRKDANTACADAVSRRFGKWPRNISQL